MKLRIEKIKKVLGKVLGKFWHNIFLILILLLALDLILGGICFLRYYLKVPGKELPSTQVLKINQGLLEEVSSRLAEKEAIFKKAKDKKYPDLFRTTFSEASLEEH